jgi:Zn-dependent protease
MIKFTGKEVRDLIISFIVITLGFCILYCNGNYGFIIELFPIVAIAVGLGFILHELGHKFSAMHYGYWAEFELWPTGLVIALVSSFFGFIFAAPGAVYIYSQYMDDKTNGIISICGPLVNIVLALIFIAVGSSLGSYAYTGTGSLIAIICLFGTRINAFLALFNLLPIPPLDGSKVLKWNIPVWLVTIVFSGILVFFTGGIF